VSSYSTLQMEHAATQAVETAHCSPLLGAQSACDTGTPGRQGREKRRESEGAVRVAINNMIKVQVMKPNSNISNESRKDKDRINGNSPYPGLRSID
jgi:hypothetical protein